MTFYIIRVLFPAIFIDIGLTRVLLKKKQKMLGTFGPALLYVISAFIWVVILAATHPAFRGQGVLGLMLLMFMGSSFSILRIVLGLALLARLNR